MKARVGWTGLVLLTSVLSLTGLGTTIVAQVIPVTSSLNSSALSAHLTAVAIGAIAFGACSVIPPRFQIWIGLAVYLAGLAGTIALRWIYDSYAWQINPPIWAANADCWWVAGGILLFSGLTTWARKPSLSKQWMVAGLIAFATFSAIQYPLEMGHHFMSLCWIVAMLGVLFGSRLHWAVSANVMAGMFLLMIVASANADREFTSGMWYFVDIEDFFPDHPDSIRNPSNNLVAIGNGGLIGHSPEVEIFSPDPKFWWRWQSSETHVLFWAENTGFVGSMGLLLIFAVLLGSCLWIGARVLSSPGSGLPVAVACIFFLRIYLTYASAVEMGPVYRWKIPLLSLGLVDLVTNLALLGCVFATWIYREDGKARVS